VAAKLSRNPGSETAAGRVGSGDSGCVPIPRIGVAFEEFVLAAGLVACAAACCRGCRDCVATSSIQKSAEQRAFERVQHSQQLLAAWLNRTNALRGFLQTDTSSAFAAFSRSAAPFQTAVQTERTDARSVARARPIVASEVQFAQRWQALRAHLRRGPPPPLPNAARLRQRGRSLSAGQPGDRVGGRGLLGRDAQIQQQL
jgi:hypothetical protein